MFGKLKSNSPELRKRAFVAFEVIFGDAGGCYVYTSTGQRIIFSDRAEFIQWVANNV